MYHHKKHKQFLKGEFTRETLLAMIPDGEFIAVFGTSHTKGCCKLEDSKYTHINAEYTWPDIVSQSLGIPYVNFAIPGVMNPTIVQQMLDFFELEGIYNRCVLVLAELRLGDISGSYFFDIFTDKYPYPPIPRTDFLGGGYVPHWFDEVSGTFVPKNNDDHIESLVRNANEIEFKDGVPKSALDQMKRIVDVYCETALCSSQKMVEDILSTRTMAHICNAHAVPFRYFNWDHNKISHSDSYFADIKEVTDELYNLDKYNFKALIPNVNMACPPAIGKDVWNTTLCECGHRNHVIHQWVAEQIIEELKNDFCS